MKNITLIIGVVILAVIGLYAYSKISLSPNTDSEMTAQKQTPLETLTDSKESAAGRYAEYTKANLEVAEAGKHTLFFYANWCPTCIPADSSIRENMSQIPPGMTVIRVNYNDTATDDEEKALAQKYGVTYQHTFVQIDQDGNVVKKWNGGGIDELLKNIR